MRRFVFFAFVLVGCRHELAQPWCVEDPNDPRCFESASGGDTGVAETGDADVPEADTNVPSCADAGPASEPCGKCGTRTRTCVADGTWGEWGACEGEGVCTPDAVETVTTACPGALEKRTRKCSASCAWEAEVCALPKGWTAIAEAPTGRIGASAVWTGGEMIVFAGSDQYEGGSVFADGALYRLNKNAWDPLPSIPTVSHGRQGHTAVWTGFAMLVWGGRNGATYLADGHEYDATKKSWKAMPAAPLTKRGSHSAVFAPSLQKMFIWGGADASGAFADGAEYDVVTDAWTKLPATTLAARQGHAMYWTGAEVIVWGGTNGSTRFADGAIYAPATKTWRPLVTAPTGARIAPKTELTASGKLVVFGGVDAATTTVTADGALATLTAPTSWANIPAPASALFASRFLPATWSVGDVFYAWSGMESTTSTFPTTGAAFDTTSGTWTALPATGAPNGRLYSTAVSTGACGIVWSGLAQPGGGVTELVGDGAIYCP